MAAPVTSADLAQLDKKVAKGDAAAALESKLLQGIRYSRGKLQLLDQRILPHESVYIDIPDAEAAWHAIRDMVVRGAPAIAIAAALALAVEIVNKAPFGSPAEARDHIKERLDYLVSSRPTAVNLGIAAEELQKTVEGAAKNEKNADGVVLAYVHAAEAMLADDVAANRAIGAFGAAAILEAVHSKKETNLRVLTHCNTGSLATAAYGTALGVIRSLFADGKLEGAVCTETRPYNQGSRLTAFELVHDGIPATLIADSAAASLSSLEKVDAIVVGADRIAANGDTANKIGTYSLALSAFHHGIPFFVAAPLTSIDSTIESGKQIQIEERTPKELTHALGGAGPQVAPTGIRVWNPAFDVTPAGLISGIVTNKGVIRKVEGASEFDIPAYIHSITDSKPQPNGAVKMSLKDRISACLPPPFHRTTKLSAEQKSKEEAARAEKEELAARGFRPLSESNVAEYLAGNTVLAGRLGGSSMEWKVREVGDGNLNYVYIVEGPSGSMVLKQALPYIRCVGESWPMTLERAFFEVSVLREHGRLAPANTPEVFFFDHPMALISMQYLAPPHIILRKGLITGTEYPHLADHMSTYMANTLFNTSLLALSTTTHKSNVSRYSSNVEMCRLTEQVVFTDPYQVAPNNRWTSPQLDDDAKAIREDADLKVAVAALKAKFCERTQALLHGDLHTGSVMVTADSTYVIDPEFGFYGPMGFDLGAFIGNLILAYFSQRGHSLEAGDRDEYKKWILRAIVDTWELFSFKFRQLWEKVAAQPGDAYPKEHFNSPEIRKTAQDAFLHELYADMLGFAGAKMIRRVVGIAHVEDLESIQDPDRRAECERGALTFAKRAIKGRLSQYPTIEAVVADLRSLAP